MNLFSNSEDYQNESENREIIIGNRANNLNIRNNRRNYRENGEIILHRNNTYINNRNYISNNFIRSYTRNSSIGVSLGSSQLNTIRNSSINLEIGNIICKIILILNILPSGIGTIIISHYKKSIFFENAFIYLIIGIIQLISFYAILVCGIVVFYFWNNINKFINISIFIYIIIFLIFNYLTSIYIGIFHNLKDTYKKKLKINDNIEKGIFIILLNIFTGGFGSMFKSYIIHKQCKICKIVQAIIEIFGFLCLLFGIFSLKKMEKTISICFISGGGISYFFSIINSVVLFKKLRVR